MNLILLLSSRAFEDKIYYFKDFEKEGAINFWPIHFFDLDRWYLWPFSFHRWTDWLGWSNPERFNFWHFDIDFTIYNYSIREFLFYVLFIPMILFGIKRKWFKKEVR